MAFLQQAAEEVNGITAITEGELSKTPAEAKELAVAPPPAQTEVENTLQVESLDQTSTSQEPNGEVPQPLVYPADPSIAFISPPPQPHIPPPQVYTHSMCTLSLPECAHLEVCRMMGVQLGQAASPLC